MRVILIDMRLRMEHFELHPFLLGQTRRGVVLSLRTLLRTLSPKLLHRTFYQRTPWGGSEDAMAGVEKRGGRKTSRMTPLPKGGFGTPPSFGTSSAPFRCQCSVFSGGTKRDKLKGTNARNSQFFADFRRFLLIFAFPGNYSILEAQKTAGNRRFSQKTAENRRFSQKPVCPI